MDKDNRIVVLIDMDCFYCQVEEKLNPKLKGKPIAVVQYNPWKGGGIIAVNYVARAKGVTRHMRGHEAKQKCPDIELPSVPCQRGKADITKYRDAGKEVAKVLQRFTPLMERASIDEAYLDITAAVQDRLQTTNINTVSSEMTPNCFALGYNSMASFVSDVHGCGEDMDFDHDHATRLLIGALVVTEIREAVYNETGYRCSAGIAHNKILAKLVCGMNKPDKQTVLPKHSVNTLFQTLPVKKVKHLGGKFGDTVCEVLRIKHMAELQLFSEKDLQDKFDEKNGSWLYNIARGIDTEPVQARYNPKSIGCCKQFRGKSALFDLYSLMRWLKDLGEEIEDRLEKDALENSRSPRQMVVSYSVQVNRDVSSSRSYNFAPDDELCGELFSSKALELVLDGMEGSKYKDGESNRQLKYPIKFLGISVGKFEDHLETKKTKKIKDYFAAGPSKENASDSRETKIEESIKFDNNVTPKCEIDFMQKFLHKKGSKDLKDDENVSSSDSNYKPRLESLLDKQESFFANILNKEGDLNQLPTSSRERNDFTNSSKESETTTEKAKVTDGVEISKDDSNDTYCSGSTIDEEINKSIALFEEDTDGVDRVSKMRQLLSTKEENEIHAAETRETVQTEEPHDSKQESIECGECGKIITMDMLDVHSDYHLALKLRDEYRQQARNEMKEKSMFKESSDKVTKNNRKSCESTNQKPQTLSSIRSFFTKVDNTVPSKICSECGKRIANEKFMEHLDYHEAQKLSREINNKVVRVVSSGTTGNTSSSDTSSVKRKRKSDSPTKKPKLLCKSINLFFKS